MGSVFTRVLGAGAGAGAGMEAAPSHEAPGCATGTGAPTEFHVVLRGGTTTEVAWTPAGHIDTTGMERVDAVVTVLPTGAFVVALTSEVVAEVSMRQKGVLGALLAQATTAPESRWVSNMDLACVAPEHGTLSVRVTGTRGRLLFEPEDLVVCTRGPRHEDWSLAQEVDTTSYNYLLPSHFKVLVVDEGSVEVAKGTLLAGAGC